MICNVYYEVVEKNDFVVVVFKMQGLSVKKDNKSNLAVFSSCCYIHAIRRISQVIHVIKMTLLLQNVRFTLPLPDEKLSHCGTTKCQPLPGRVHTNCRNLVLWDTSNIRISYNRYIILYTRDVVLHIKWVTEH